MVHDIAAVEASIATIAPTPGMRMMFLYLRGGSGIYYLFGDESGSADLIHALGGIDVASEIGWRGMQPITDEATIAFTACRQVMPDPEFYAQCIEDSFTELRDAARAALADGPPSPTSNSKAAQPVPKAAAAHKQKPTAKKGAAKSGKVAKKK